MEQLNVLKIASQIIDEILKALDKYLGTKLLNVKDQNDNEDAD